MAKVTLTKNELKKQKDDLKRFRRYLPTLQLKKRQLQLEVEKVKGHLRQAREQLRAVLGEMEPWLDLLGEEIGLEQLIQPQQVRLHWDNVAGVDIPVLDQVQLYVEKYDLFVYPLWIDRAAGSLQTLMHYAAEIAVREDQLRRLREELRMTSQRVNLFEQIKIPEATENIRRISIALADQQTTAFGWALRAKKKLYD
jgi:V/A-type H+-transporting ATPase subunit D